MSIDDTSSNAHQFNAPQILSILKDFEETSDLTVRALLKTSLKTGRQDPYIREMLDQHYRLRGLIIPVREVVMRLEKVQKNEAQIAPNHHAGDYTFDDEAPDFLKDETPSHPSSHLMGDYQ